MCFKEKWAIIFDMKKQAVKNLTIFIVLLALIAGAFSCGFFTNDVAYAAVLPDAVSIQWFDGEDYNNFKDTLQAINKIKDGLSTAEKADFKERNSKFGILRFGDGLLESSHTKAATILGNAMLSGDFEDFNSMLDNGVETTLYGNKTIVGIIVTHAIT